MRKLILFCLLPAAAYGQGLNRSQVTSTNSAASYTATSTSGADFIASATSGNKAIQIIQNSKICMNGAACTTSIYYDGNYLQVAGQGLFVGGNAGFTGAYSWYAASGQPFNIQGQPNDGSTAVALNVISANTLSNATAKIASFQNPASTEKAAVYANGSIKSATEHTLMTWGLGATGTALATGSCPATGTGCIASILPAQAFTFTAITAEASVASGGGAANTVITCTDATNTCTFTIPCNSAPPNGTSSAGPIRISAANGAGTGCVYAASASLTCSVTTAGCTTTQPTMHDIQFKGTWQ